MGEGEGRMAEEAESVGQIGVKSGSGGGARVRGGGAEGGYHQMASIIPNIQILIVTHWPGHGAKPCVFTVLKV